MKLLIQRVRSAKVDVGDDCVGRIEQGLLVFAGIEKHDSETVIEALLERMLSYRVFSDEQGKMNRSVRDVKGGVLFVSQFTLAADTRKGLRPSFSSAAVPDQAEVLYDKACRWLSANHGPVATGQFAADMQVSLVNDGPVTFMLESARGSSATVK